MLIEAPGNNFRSPETRTSVIRMLNERTFILALSCQAKPGINAAVTEILAGLGANITEMAQFWDRDSDRYFLRIAFLVPVDSTAEAFRQRLATTVGRFGMDAKIFDGSSPARILVMVSRFDHALRHLLYQVQVGWLPAEIVAVVSNHKDACRSMELGGIPFFHVPTTPEAKSAAEQRLTEIVCETDAELVVLARYMQVLSPELTAQLSGRVINIHHSFLPSFKGAKPYHQAHARGVKLIGATAHYVTPDLDEGPIIDQETERVSHSAEPDDLVAIGRDIEARVLTRAVKSHVERRVMLNGSRTVVFNN